MGLGPAGKSGENRTEGHLQNLEEETREPSREVATVTRRLGLLVF